MSNARWRERREAYLRERGRTADLVSEGFVPGGFQALEGGGQRLQGPKTQLALILGGRFRAKHVPKGEGSR
jgi:hypothetical protein